MRSMTGYGRGQSTFDGARFSVELNSVNRKQSDVTVSLPREFNELEPRVRDLINSRISRGRLNVVVSFQPGTSPAVRLAIDTTLAAAYHKAMVDLRDALGAGGEVTIETVLRSPGVLRMPEDSLEIENAWPHLESALSTALDDLIRMREREGKHLAKDMIKRLKLVRQALRKIRQLHPGVVKKYRQTLHERIARAGLELPLDDERLVREVILFADKSDISEELIRLESHLAQFAHTLRKLEPVGRTLDFITQEIYREFNTLGAKANDAEISQLVVTCKAEMEKIREQIQNIE
ncbi:MAG TPA: YicC/YloC family endoribonuclease [Chthoniobacteraceae bacterium]|nr:YicC/YloC family endoribonuclease [Chthoniobacteraceae bacterium]